MHETFSMNTAKYLIDSNPNSFDHLNLKIIQTLNLVSQNILSRAKSLIWTSEGV